MARRLLLGMCCVLLAGNVGGRPEQQAAPRWLTNLEQAEKDAKKSGKLLFVVFRCEH